MIVLALDLSLRSTGCVLLPSDWGLDWKRVRSKAIVHGTLAKDAGVVTRALRMRAIVSDVLAFGAGCDLVALEEQAFNAHGMYARELGELTGAVKVALLSLGVPITTVPVASARKTLLGKVPRKDAKVHTERAVRSFGCPFKTTDEVDAWVIGNHVLSLHGHQAVTVREAAA